jgi:hypothetical protein
MFKAIEKLIKDGMQCPSKTKPIKYNVAKNEVSPPVCCRTLYFLAIDNERRTPVQPTVRRRISRSCRSVEDSFCDTARKLEKTPYAHCENNAMHVSKTTIVHCLAPQKIGRETCVDLKQARPRIAKWHRLRTR